MKDGEMLMTVAAMSELYSVCVVVELTGDANVASRLRFNLDLLTRILQQHLIAGLPSPEER